MLLTVVNLTQWTCIFEVTKDPIIAMSHLRELSQNLVLCVQTDSKDFDKALLHTAIIEKVIREANCTDEEQPNKTDGSSTLQHPFLAHLSLDDVQKCAAEDLQDSISMSQTERARAALVNAGSKLNIPFIPRRAVEDQLSLWDQQCWTIDNINLLDPIPPAL
jgi:hypothetical protein